MGIFSLLIGYVPPKNFVSISSGETAFNGLKLIFFFFKLEKKIAHAITICI